MSEREDPDVSLLMRGRSLFDYGAVLPLPCVPRAREGMPCQSGHGASHGDPLSDEAMDALLALIPAGSAKGLWRIRLSGAMVATGVAMGLGTLVSGGSIFGASRLGNGGLCAACVACVALWHSIQAFPKAWSETQWHLRHIWLWVGGLIPPGWDADADRHLGLVHQMAHHYVCKLPLSDTDRRRHLDALQGPFIHRRQMLAAMGEVVMEARAEAFLSNQSLP